MFYIIITAMAAEKPVLAQSMPMRTASLAVINNKIFQGWLVFCLLLFSVKSIFATSAVSTRLNLPVTQTCKFRRGIFLRTAV